MRTLVALLFAVSLLYSCEAEGPSAVTTVFVKKGDDLILNVDADVPEVHIFVGWKFNKKVDFVVFTPDGKRSVFPDFTRRIEFPVKKFSVILKNVQEADSGVYAARVFTVLGGDKPLAEYEVTVQGPVSPVELTVDSVVPGGSDSCNLTVTCSTQHSHISSTFRCVNRTCSQDGGKQSEVTSSGASLQVYLLNSEITCNHSNHFNWTKDFKMTECPKYPAPDPKHDAGTDHFLVIVIITILILVIIVGLLMVVRYRRKRRNSDTRESIENTVYEVPQVQSLDQSPTDDASGLSPTSTYCLVGPHTGSLIPTETRGTTLPESLYAQVEKTPRSFDN